MAAAGGFAAVSAIFGSPVIGAVLIIEATGLGGPTLPLVLLPGLLAAGVGSLVFIGLGSWSGFSTAAWALSPFPLPDYGGPGWGDFGWTILLAVGRRDRRVRDHGAGPLVKAVRRPAVRSCSRSLPGSPLAGLRSPSRRQPASRRRGALLRSGGVRHAVRSPATISLSTLALLLLFKGLAWTISLGNFRGGPTFPAIFLGVVGRADGRAPTRLRRDAGRGRAGRRRLRAVLRLPLASVMIASLLCAKAGLTVAPLVVVAVVVAYLTSEALTAYVDARIGAAPGGRRTAGATSDSPLSGST